MSKAKDSGQWTVDGRLRLETVGGRQSAVLLSLTLPSVGAASRPRIQYVA